MLVFEATSEEVALFMSIQRTRLEKNMDKRVTISETFLNGIASRAGHAKAALYIGACEVESLIRAWDDALPDAVKERLQAIADKMTTHLMEIEEETSV